MNTAVRLKDQATDRLAHFLARHDEKPLLRLITCGSVDDGKSTLIGRLLYDTKLIFEDQLAALASDSRRHGTTGDDIDLALLVDGLEAEREQGITIDVAYRYFATPKRKFIVADTPGHIQYTRNMATGASTADLAIVLVDARKGVIEQTRRHSFIAALLGVRNVVLAVNKMDLVGHDREVFARIEEDYRAFAGKLAFASVKAIPISARFGDNVLEPSAAMGWYRGPTLLAHLETVAIDAKDVAPQPFRLPVQWVNRPNADFRGYAGTIAAGRVRVGDALAVAASGQASQVRRILVGDRDVGEAGAGAAVTLTLADELDISRGDLLAAPAARPILSDRLVATLVWFDAAPLHPGDSYLLRTETRQISATIKALEHRIDIATLEPQPAQALAMNDIGAVEIRTQAPIAFDRYADNRITGSFILIDRQTNATVAAGMIDRAADRAGDVRWQALDIDKAARSARKGQQPAVLWFTGLSGSGKSTIANLLEKRLFAGGRHTYLLDGDNVRHGLNRDLGFTDADRVENIRRVTEVARLMADAGLIVLVSFISPFAADRRMARERMGEGEFVEIFIDTPVEECARRDPKGLYARALKGEIANFTGVDSPYEAPENPDLHLPTLGRRPGELVDEIERWLIARGVIPSEGEFGGGI